MDAYKDWINKLYNEWPLSGPTLTSGRTKKKNAGEVSITILAEIVDNDSFVKLIQNNSVHIIF